MISFRQNLSKKLLFKILQSDRKFVLRAAILDKQFQTVRILAKKMPIMSYMCSAHN